MSKKIKFVVIVLISGFLVYHYHNEIHRFIDSLPFSIPFLTTDEEETKDKGSFEYYFRNNNADEEQHEENSWNIYDN